MFYGNTFVSAYFDRVKGVCALNVYEFLKKLAILIGVLIFIGFALFLNNGHPLVWFLFFDGLSHIS